MGRALWHVSDPILMILPPLFTCLRWRQNACDITNAAVRFTSITRFQLLSSTSSAGPRIVVPAQLIRISTPPVLKITFSKKLTISSISARSNENVHTFLQVLAWICFLATSSCFSVRAVITTSAPCSASPWATASPMPLLPPVTRAVFLAKLKRPFPILL